MDRALGSQQGAKKGTYVAPRIAREVGGVEPYRLLRLWRKVLERRLRSRLREEVKVELHDNTHTMVTYRHDEGQWRLRLHHMFLAAPDEVLAALVGFVRKADSASSAALDRYIERNKELIRKVPAAQLRKRLRIVTQGRCHDLHRIFTSLNARYFQSQVNATITYGTAPRGQGPRKSIKMGSYSADSKVIRIHPALDHHLVPRYFVEWIVFHEMLHHVYRARRGQDGRRCVHTPEFLAQERTFHDLGRAQQWEADNLDFLLRSG